MTRAKNSAKDLIMTRNPLWKLWWWVMSRWSLMPELTCFPDVDASEDVCFHSRVPNVAEFGKAVAG